MIGKKLGHYRITSRLGKDGIREAYRAHDTKLSRDVALKVCHLNETSGTHQALQARGAVVGIVFHLIGSSTCAYLLLAVCFLG